MESIIITVLTQVLSLIASGKLASDTALVTWVIGLLENVATFLGAEYKTALPMFMDIIDKLRSTAPISDDDDAKLTALETKLDADFEATAAAAGAPPEDPPPTA